MEGLVCLIVKLDRNTSAAIFQFGNMWTLWTGNFPGINTKFQTGFPLFPCGTTSESTKCQTCCCSTAGYAVPKPCIQAIHSRMILHGLILTIPFLNNIQMIAWDIMGHEFRTHFGVSVLSRCSWCLVKNRCGFRAVVINHHQPLQNQWMFTP